MLREEVVAGRGAEPAILGVDPYDPADAPPTAPPLRPTDRRRRPAIRALILAAGRGERLRPLTDRTPKPLLSVHGRRLIEWHLLALRDGGVREVVVNTAWLEEQFPAVLGDGSRYGVSIRYSTEGRDHGGALETAGGIAKALPWLGERFWVVSGDVHLPGFRFEPSAVDKLHGGERLAHLWLVANAPHHPHGDFGIDADGLARSDLEPRYTWASVGLFDARMFAGIAPGTRLPLRPLLERAIAERRLGAERWPGSWTDVGTVERLLALGGHAPAAPELSPPAGR